MNSPSNIRIRSRNTLIATTLASLLLAACAMGPARPEGSAQVRNKLTQLQSDPELASRAPVAIKEAEVAVAAAEVPEDDAELARHRVFTADRKVDIAWALAQSRLAEDQRTALSAERESARLDARTREANLARGEARSARSEADLARIQAADARNAAEIARSQASSARTEAEIARSQADAASMAADDSRRQADALQRQIAELNAKATDRGLVVTLGDVLFATGRAELKGSVPSNLSKLAAFLNEYPDRSVIIEGHTDSVGAEGYNRDLSQRRADTVKSYLMRQGVGPNRVVASGLGEGSPVADNTSVTGRQQNRRVEVIISNTVTSSR